MLAQDILHQVQSMQLLHGLIKATMESSGFVAAFSGFGAVTTVLETDPKQYTTRDGRWTFDPRNRNYEKAFHLAWPEIVDWRERVNLGNVLEAILGVREQAFAQRHFLQENPAVLGVCSRLSAFVNSVYQFTRYTNTEYMDVPAWLTYVQNLASVVY